MEGNHHRKIFGGENKRTQILEDNDTILNAGAKGEKNAISENTMNK